MKFKTGDLVVYGSTGVCQVTDIAVPEFSSGANKRLHYVLKPLNQGCLIYTPTDNTKVFMRSVISREEAERLIDMIPTIRAEAFHSRVLRQLSDHYEESFKTHSCGDLIELTMSIYAKKLTCERQKRKFGAVDVRYMKRAEDLLFGELSAALGMPRDEIPDYIASRVGPMDMQPDATQID